MSDSGTRELWSFANKKVKIDNEAAVKKSQDPRLVFCDGVITTVLMKLDVCSISVARAVNSDWLTVASSDHLWAFKCAELWQGKAHIPRISNVPGLSKMKATLLSVMDGKRNRITWDDLCDHAWEFHFSETASAYWRDQDPYYGAPGTPMRRYFHADGTITAEPNDRIWGGQTSCTVIPGTLCEGRITGHYVMVDNWAQMSVVRKPDWSWVLSNQIYCFSSIPDATDDDKVDGTGPSSPISG